ncbi:MAG: FAD-dependent oxidoreductase, partial [Paenibacillaceae bacterium]|nr:FAD-dependent oxidoreductase [Paenibacillaceae bacterium]
PKLGVQTASQSEHAHLGGVNNWEPGVGGLGVHYELFERMKAIGAIGVAKTTHDYSEREPYALSEIDPDEPYERSLKGGKLDGDKRRRVQFEADAMAATMEAMLMEAGNVRIHYRSRVTEATVSGRRVRSVTVQTASADAVVMRAKLYIDCSGGVILAKMAGCSTAFGEDGFAAYGEPSAPAEPQPNVNGVTLVYRVKRTEEPVAAELPEYEEAGLDEQAKRWPLDKIRVPFITAYPNGDLCVNLLPVMQGKEFHDLPPDRAREICAARGLAHWHWLKRTQPGFAHFRFQMHFPLVGIRESDRLVGQYVLTENDVRAGYAAQPLQDRLIAFADHSLDTHGQSNIRKPLDKRLDQPYGIPYDCLLPRELDNLAVATRGASFSHIAASSCRLSRTMMAMGEAAGMAAAIALREGTNFPEVPLPDLRHKLRIPEMSEKLKREYHRI